MARSLPRFAQTIFRASSWPGSKTVRGALLGGGIVFSGALLAAGSSANQSSGPQPAPLKAEPEAQASGGTVTLSHLRRKITTCHKIREDGESFCDAASYSEKTGETSIKLIPLTKAGDPDPGPRSEISVQFPKQPGKQSVVKKLARGRWELAWKDGSTLRERFFVVPRDKFEIELESTSGMCVEEGQGCKLEPGKRQRSVEIPKVRGVD